MTEKGTLLEFLRRDHAVDGRVEADFMSRALQRDGYVNEWLEQSTCILDDKVRSESMRK